MERTIHIYSVKVYTRGMYESHRFEDEDGYQDWGVSYPTKDEAVNKFRDYISTCRRLALKGDMYKKELEFYLSKPIKVIHKTVVEKITTETIMVSDI